MLLYSGCIFEISGTDTPNLNELLSDPELLEAFQVGTKCCPCRKLCHNLNFESSIESDPGLCVFLLHHAL